MRIHALLFAVVTALLATAIVPVFAQTSGAGEIKMVVVLMRHGVRSPTHPAELQPYARDKWPAWNVKPGYLTPHGAALARQLGAYYRTQLTGGLGLPAGCAVKDSTYVWADVDERTIETGRSIAEGFAPGCGIAVNHAAGDNDTLFDPLPGTGHVDRKEAMAALEGAVGGNPSAVLGAYRGALSTMEGVLGCPAANCTTIASVPTVAKSKGDGGLASLSGGLDVAADVAENLLLEYTNGNATVGWGRVDRDKLVQMLQLHVINKRLEHGNRYTARAHSSNVMAHVLDTLRQGATGAPIAGSIAPLPSRAVFVVGHDTQLAELAGLLGLSWLVPGDQMNDTPPDSALVYELHAPANGSSESFVRVYFVAQSLDDMRAGRGTNPQRVPVYVPGCPSYDCPIETFSKVVNAAIDPNFVAQR